MKFLKITINKTEKELVTFLREVSKDIKTELFYLEQEIIDVSLVSDEGYCVIFLSINKHQEDKLFNLYKNIELPITITDLTNDCINSFFNTQDKDVLKAIKTEWGFEEMVSDFILKNSTIDDVLDKISKHGISSLLEADYKILENI